MIDFNHSSISNSRPDDSVMAHEHESGFLLPQLMGALARDSGFPSLRDCSQQSARSVFFLKLRTSLKRALTLRDLPH
ncbi:hypothetical protein [Pseudomonas frederiksbergensis]|uniref:hypothetical protein n=1 Tax=Pseudomonas frederiksbergensis TaxID=104087 RepID=UPI0011CE2F26|nr:hypothetical protein [Pseudomonas frederiksbergensis]